MCNNSKIYTVLVAYNSTKQDLSPAVNELLRQTSFVVICNNSKDDLIYRHPRIKVLNFRDNLGIARAQTLGMTWAYENGADFVLQMDQDSLPDPDMVKLLYESYLALGIANYNIGMIGPQSYDRYTKKLHGNKSKVAPFQKGKIVPDFEGIDIVDSMISSGSLIPQKSFQAIGGMLDELFIDHVDLEYCWRLRGNGFLIVRNNKARLAHRSGEGRTSFLIIFDVAVSVPIRHYYWFRNLLYLFNRSYVPTYWKVKSVLKIIFRMLFYPFFLNNGFECFKFMLLGIKDGVRKKMYRIDSFS
ncbi:MAG: glycosyltransferase family 2 protein [Methylotenera sp.]|uniref:glycosyltransferase family 2 protein n=1 Tax=Methylotenera sp. TaxID=2051956 RepID=UPI001844DE6C|nr:glycosyltransferase family 2 protein [Methylotenera sp.]NOU24886.1 glycosyltransferase family 2 protein [Methylotenera sp.]